jgi:MFS family permease
MVNEASEVARDYRRNLIANVSDGVVWQFGMAFISVQAILPVYVSRLTPSEVLIGLIPAIFELGWYLPQLFVAQYVTRLARTKPMVLVLGGAERLSILAIALVAVFAEQASPAALLWLFFGLHTLRSLFGGILGNGWQEMIARIFPPRKRGLYFGTTFALGGVVGLIGAAGAREVLAGSAFPVNFGWSFLIGFSATAASWICLTFTREPSVAPAEAALSGRDYWRSIPVIWRQDHNFRRYIISRLVASFGNMATGFYAVAAVRRFDLGDEQAAVFSALLFGSAVVANPAWGWLGDRFGHKLTLELSGVLLLASLGCVLAAPSVLFYYLAFAVLGASNSGNIIATLAVTMEFAPPAQRPVYIGLAHTLRAPVIGLAPLLGGWLAGRFDYPAMFAVTLVPVALAVVLTRLTVAEPRLAENC